jgi:hypothetical protein
MRSSARRSSACNWSGALSYGELPATWAWAQTKPMTPSRTPLLRTWAAMRGPQSIDRPDAWAFKALYRLVMDRHRFRRRLRLLAERIGVQQRHRSTGVDHAERMAVWEAVERLPERQRLAVYLRFRADLPGGPRPPRRPIH